MQHMMPRALRAHQDPALVGEWQRLADNLYSLLSVGEYPYPIELRLTTTAGETFYLTARAADVLGAASTVRTLRGLLEMISTTSHLSDEIAAIVAHALRLTVDYAELSAKHSSASMAVPDPDPEATLRDLLGWLTLPGEEDLRG